MTLTLLDTFSGIGGFSYAAEQLVGGFKTTQFVEKEPYCQKILKKHWPDVPIHDDIKTFTAEPFQFDCIAGGFPCQDVSVAGQQRGITKQTRSGLFYELIRVIRMVRPKYVLLENVAALLNNGMGIVLGELSEIGYDVEWKVISARERGACHLRQRVWIIAYPKSGRCGRGSSEERAIQERKLFPGEQTRGEMGSETKGCSISTANTNHNGQQGREFETRNQDDARQNSQSKWSANTENIERHNNDGSDTTEPRVDGDLQRSPDGGKAIPTNTGGVCKLSKETNNNKKISGENKDQEDNNRTLVSQRQEGIQLSLNRTLANNQTTLEDNTVRHGDDSNANQRMDKQGGDATNTKSKGLQGRTRNNKGEGWKVLSTEQHNRNEIRSETRCIDGVSSEQRYVADTNSLQRFDLLRQQPKQGQETQQGVSDRSDRSRDVADTQHDGSFTTEKSRSIEETNGRATQGENKACKLERSSTPRNTGTVQYDEGVTDTKNISGNVRKSRDNQTKEKGEWEFRGCDSRYVTNTNESRSREGGVSEHIANEGWRTCEGGTESVQSKNREARSSNFRQSGRDESTNSLHEGSQGFRGECKLPEGSGKRQIIWRSQPHLLNPNWRGYISKPTLRRGDDGLSNRVDRLKALGNSIVPAVATIPLGRILDLEKL